MEKLRNFARGLITLLGGALIYATAYYLANLFLGNIDSVKIWIPYISVMLGIIAAIITFFISPKLVDGLMVLNKQFQEMPIQDVFLGGIGLAIGLFIAYLLTRLADRIPSNGLALVISIILYSVLAYLGISTARRRSGDFNLNKAIKNALLSINKEKEVKLDNKIKILDTCVLIDGRIVDIVKTGFLEGRLIVPRFVLNEMQYIADSPDMLKRGRGRRGLDMLAALQEQNNVVIEIVDDDQDPSLEVDNRLLIMAKNLNAYVITNDYNLNKVAVVENITVLNINDLANALKPVALPGEDMVIDIVKDGREAGQGVGYLKDGTMVVVEGGFKHIGTTVHVIVTNAMQTSAGRMIFTKMLELEDE